MFFDHIRIKLEISSLKVTGKILTYLEMKQYNSKWVLHIKENIIRKIRVYFKLNI